MDTTQNINLNNVTELTGRRFRPTKEQSARINSGEITREQAFQEALANGWLDREPLKKDPIPQSFWLTEGLTLENFSEVSNRVLGKTRKFRISKDQKDRGLSREEAFAERVRIEQEKTS